MEAICQKHREDDRAQYGCWQGRNLCNVAKTSAAPPPTITPTKGKKAAAFPMSISGTVKSLWDGQSRQELHGN